MSHTYWSAMPSLCASKSACANVPRKGNIQISEASMGSEIKYHRFWAHTCSRIIVTQREWKLEVTADDANWNKKSWACTAIRGPCYMRPPPCSTSISCCGPTPYILALAASHWPWSSKVHPSSREALVPQGAIRPMQVVIPFLVLSLNHRLFGEHGLSSKSKCT
jgi:hypothetical protein